MKEHYSFAGFIQNNACATVCAHGRLAAFGTGVLRQVCRRNTSIWFFACCSRSNVLVRHEQRRINNMREKVDLRIPGMHSFLTYTGWRCVLRVCITACLAWLPLAGCSQQKREPSPERLTTAVFDLESRVLNPDMWNPFVPGARTDQGYHQALIEPLFMLNFESGEIEPWLALSMTSNEALDVWTLTLRPGVKWSDGVPFTAADVVFTVEMLLDNAPSLLYSAGLQQWIDRVERVDDLTVRFYLKEPNPRFQLDYWSIKIYNSVYIVPKHIWHDKDPMTFKNYDRERGWPVFTGPYRLKQFTETEFSYARDDNWWGAASGWKPLPEPESLVWVWYGPEETRTAATADDELDSLCDISLGAFQALGYRKPDVFAWLDEPPYAWVDPCARTLEFNHDRPPWDDKEMRWAINHALDRDVIVAVAYEGTTTPARHFFPEYPSLNRLVQLLDDAGLYEKYPLMTYDPDLTRRILESKGYSLNRRGYYEKNGETLSMIITTHEAYIEKQRIAQVIVEQLQAVGINATHRNEAGGAWTDNFQFGNFEAQMGWMSCGSVNEPWSSMDTFSAHWRVPVGERSQFNCWRWENHAYTALVDEMGTLPLHDPHIDDLFIEAMEIWLDALPIIPVTQAKKLLPFNPTFWSGWPDAENNYQHPCTWWQSTHIIIHELRRTEMTEAPQPDE